MPDCRHGDGEAIIRVSIPRGCTCFPSDREQDLCAQHVHRLQREFSVIRTYLADHSQDAALLRWLGIGETLPADRATIR